MRSSHVWCLAAFCSCLLITDGAPTYRDTTILEDALLSLHLSPVTVKTSHPIQSPANPTLRPDTPLLFDLELGNSAMDVEAEDQHAMEQNPSRHELIEHGDLPDAQQLLLNAKAFRQGVDKILIVHYGDQAAGTWSLLYEFAYFNLQLPEEYLSKGVAFGMDDYYFSQHPGKLHLNTRLQSEVRLKMQHLRSSGLNFDEDSVEAFFEQDACRKSSQLYFGQRSLPSAEHWQSYLYRYFSAHHPLLVYTPSPQHHSDKHLRQELLNVFELAHDFDYYVITVFPHFDVDTTVKRNRQRFTHPEAAPREFLYCREQVTVTRSRILHEFVELVLDQSHEVYLLDSTFYKDEFTQEDNSLVPISKQAPFLLPDLNGMALFYHHRYVQGHPTSAIFRPAIGLHFTPSRKSSYISESKEEERLGLSQPFHDGKVREYFLGCGHPLRLQYDSLHRLVSPASGWFQLDESIPVAAKEERDLFREWIYRGCLLV